MKSVRIRTLATGVPGFDEVLGGGIPELSFNIIVGGPGCGKTTLGHQIAFANASKDHPALYISIIGEPPLKMLRYQQQYSFFDTQKIGDGIRFLHLGEEARSGGLGKVLELIVQEVEKTTPSIVIVDSFRSMLRTPEGSDLVLQDFIQRLALHLTAFEATTFLIGELHDDDLESPIFTVADGVVALKQAVDRNAVVRKLQVVKIRGSAQIPGLHTMRITSDGVSVFPRLLKLEEHPTPAFSLAHRLSTGVAGVDAMLEGGIPQGYSVLVAGPSGSGKTVLANEFILDGARRGEPGIIVVFERRPDDYVRTTPFGHEFTRLMHEGLLEILYLRPLDLSIDETLVEIRKAVQRTNAKRAVIDSLSGLELALAPTFREDFRESLYRMVGALTGLGVTVLSTVDLTDTFTGLSFSPHGIAFLTDVIVLQRYVEIDGDLRRAMAVVKLRGSGHDKSLREYEITAEGRLVVRAPLRGYDGLLSGTPHHSEGKHGAGKPG